MYVVVVKHDQQAHGFVEDGAGYAAVKGFWMTVQAWPGDGKHRDCFGVFGGYGRGSVVCDCGCARVGARFDGHEITELQGDHVGDCAFRVYGAGEEVVFTRGFEVSREGWDDLVLGR